MKIIRGYWSDKKAEIKAEKTIKKHLKKHEIKKVFVGYKEIKSFKITFDDRGWFTILYALRKNASLKYYARFLGQSAAIHKNTIVFLWDDNWQDYENGIINEKTKKLLIN